MKTINNFINERLDQHKTENLLRQLSNNDSLIDFSSSDYLGFARSQELKELFENTLKEYPNYKLGSTGSRLLTGNHAFTETLEDAIAAFHCAESALIFNSGYVANLGLLASLPQRGDTIIIDELVHASTIDGTKLSYANKYNFKHNDLDSLEQKLKRATGKIYIAVESIYSMDGDTAPLQELCDLADRYDAALLVDEIHATGVFGHQGRGLVEELGLSRRVFARTITFGKALGTHGAAILGSNQLRSYLVNFARPMIYSTAASFVSHAATQAAYQFLTQRDHQSDIHQRIAYFKKEVGSSVRLIESKSPIQIVLVPGKKEAKNAAQKLQHAGFDIRAILSPSVKSGSERLRICLHNHNSFEEIKELAFILKKMGV